MEHQGICLKETSSRNVSQTMPFFYLPTPQGVGERRLMVKVVIKGAYFGNRTLPGLNDWLAEYGRNPKAGGRFKEDYMRVCLSSIRRCLLGWKVTKPPIITHFRYFESKKGKRRDVDNIHGFCIKVFHDSLQKCGVIKNDNPEWIENFTTEFHWVDGDPYIEIEIEERG